LVKTKTKPETIEVEPPTEAQVLAKQKQEVLLDESNVAKQDEKLAKMEAMEDDKHVFCHSEDPTNCIAPKKWSAMGFQATKNDDITIPRNMAVIVDVAEINVKRLYVRSKFEK